MPSNSFPSPHRTSPPRHRAGGWGEDCPEAHHAAHAATDPWRNRIVVGGLALCIVLVFAPTLYISTVTHRRDAAARGVATLAEAMARFHDDLGRWPVEGDADGAAGSDEVRCLATRDGEWPSLADGVTGWGEWSPRDTFENHLRANRPLGRPAHAYPTRIDRAWRGPYVGDVGSDPWGRKYVANVWNGHDDRSGPLWVLSAGPNGVVDTRPSSRTLAGDDIGRLLRH